MDQPSHQASAWSTHLSLVILFVHVALYPWNSSGRRQLSHSAPSVHCSSRYIATLRASVTGDSTFTAGRAAAHHPPPALYSSHSQWAGQPARRHRTLPRPAHGGGETGRPDRAQEHQEKVVPRYRCLLQFLGYVREDLSHGVLSDYAENLVMSLNSFK